LIQANTDVDVRVGNIRHVDVIVENGSVSRPSHCRVISFDSHRLKILRRERLTNGAANVAANIAGTAGHKDAFARHDWNARLESKSNI
jgi:hypothetical protein